MSFEVSIAMKQFVITTFILCVFSLNNVYGDVSSLEGVKTFPSTTSSTSPENSNSFSILTKEFLNKPDGEVGKRNTLKPQPSGRSPTVRINGIDSNNNNNKLAETDDSDERQAYYYDKPKIPFNLPDSSNIQINTVPPKNDQIEDFNGYDYPKPAIPFPPPTTTNGPNPDAESLPSDSARYTKESNDLT